MDHDSAVAVDGSSDDVRLAGEEAVVRLLTVRVIAHVLDVRTHEGVTYPSVDRSSA